MIGSMGLASSIGLGVSLKNPKKLIYVFDGDGNILMNLGSMTTIGKLKPKNLVHIINVYDVTRRRAYMFTLLYARTSLRSVWNHPANVKLVLVITCLWGWFGINHPSCFTKLCNHPSEARMI